MVVVVSEETGIISIANNGRLVRGLDDAKLRKVLSILYRPAFSGGPSWLYPGRSQDGSAVGSGAGSSRGTPVAGVLAPLAMVLGLLLSKLSDLFGRGGSGLR